MPNELEGLESPEVVIGVSPLDEIPEHLIPLTITLMSRNAYNYYQVCWVVSDKIIFKDLLWVLCGPH